MTERKHDALEQVYAARTADELAAAYAAWAAGYDRDTLAAGYCLPFQVLSWVARHVRPDAGPVLDAGCGTGLSGPYLKALGYGRIEGLDLSEDMLRVAGSRGVYDNLKRATLGETLPWTDNHFAAFLSTGVFTEGHAPASSLAELCRITRPGGIAVFTVRDKIFETGGFTAVIEDLTTRGIWRKIEQSSPFRAFALDEPDVLVTAFVFEVLA
ncbi:MAG: class I SAM-dependent methyltransferase [Hoeflea sp.]|uniref:class I SAM-dependent DNA methyltransferase n=1 Tax=Hoeflea sp. TaxID=1940281 RepID=UPI001D811F25|nr:class I SAM-dependent methyltransferase [Hoeflea sp.]MBU4529844.1 class I SAM-dependent methyltransferase [Alphaproteobacteria bacterium]MBU4547135.1 class I SAM-dependent methyltransferase [Alphaproteobacteria bacterium]MBU4548748.1 class I SAM-dependent methyltransferase [Alphaproteobacteria bacterium]MBV1722337.1 class I SAM-dependent methyltransferase [Hoeflea sp.]MBV1762506.1 class I SAM-dependent methyltransferase [Hoeflea sp.]